MFTARHFKIYNSLTREVSDFKPIEPNKVGLYVCGITPYGLTHVGNARTMLVFDTLVRFLRAVGWQVKFVRNFTDIDDKIIQRAKHDHVTPEHIAQTFIQAFHNDMAGLNIQPADIEPLVSTHLEPIQGIIHKLIDRGLAYIHPENGDVMYEVAKFSGYGKLSGRRIEQQQAGARVEVDEGKKHPFDFVLWKRAKPGEPQWASPWGAGRPGWHIECSAMGCTHLGETFDIHGGGMDLQFPHHENEIAQSEGAHGTDYVHYWMHVAFIQQNQEKMSKSLGNIMTVRDALQQLPGEAIRLNFLSTHYRQPLEFSTQAVEQSAQGLARLYRALERTKHLAVEPEAGAAYLKPLYDALANDLDTPGAIAVMFDIAGQLNKALDQDDPAEAKACKAALLEAGQVLGLLQLTPEAYLQRDQGGLSNAEVESRINARLAARAAKNWAEADRIRDELTKQGIVLEDTPQGTKWSRA